MGRTRQPKELADLKGSFIKHPEREAAYANTPRPTGLIGPPPADWLPDARAVELFAQGSDAHAVATELGIQWERAKTLRPGSPEFIRNAELVSIWHELVSQAPPGVLLWSDRIHLEATCRILQRIRSGDDRPGDFNRLKEFLGKMAMNPADRTKVQVIVGGVAAQPDPASSSAAGREPNVNVFEQLASEERERTAVN
jgi:hypothetical protein